MNNKIQSSRDAVDFFKEDYVDQASYDNLRKIASCIDGLKNANRKVIYTILENNIFNLTKVSQLSAKAGEFADYLHGSLDGVVVTLAQDYLGTNQCPLLQKKGNFGTRAIQDPAASRYIFASGSSFLKEWFNDQDRKLLVEQTFEGSKIEPRYYVPDLPVLLINGSKGVSSGFAQNILPRNLKTIKNIIESFCETQDPDALKKINEAKPFIGNFNGVVSRDFETSDYRWIFTAKFSIEANRVTIHDIPYGSDLRSFLAVLDKLEEDKTIKKYEDLTDGDDFKFVVTFDKKIDLSKVDIIKLFKLRTSITENFTCMDENNKIFEAKSPFDILNRYTKVKLEYLEKRKSLMLSELNDKLNKNNSMLFVIKQVIQNKIDFRVTNTKDLNLMFAENELYASPGDSYDGFGYLHRIPVGKMTQDEVQLLEDKIADNKENIALIERCSIFDIWRGHGQVESK